MPGGIISVQVELRSAKFRLVSIYLHPNELKADLQTLLKVLKMFDLRVCENGHFSLVTSILAMFLTVNRGTSSLNCTASLMVTHSLPPSA